MRLVGMNPVVVHGGGPQITELMRRLGKEPEFVDGRRVTDAETVDIVRMALVGKVNREIVASVNRHGSYAVGLSGEDAGLIRVDQRDPRLGFVGDVRAIDPTMVLRLLREELIPVIATIGVDDNGQAYNINADTVAGAIAEALTAEKLVYLTDVAGVYGDWPDESSLISRVDVDGLEKLVADGKASEGMIPKLESCAPCAAPRRAPRAHPRRAAAARAAAGVLHEGGCRNDGAPVTAVAWRSCRRSTPSTSCRPTAGCRSRSCAATGHGSGTARARSTSTSSPASRSRRSVTRTPRSPPRSPTRRARCCTSRTSTTTTCSRRSRRSSTRCSAAAAACSSATRAPRRTSARSSSPRRHGQRNGGPERFHVISAYGSFHGRTLTTLAATGQPQKQETFQPLPEGFRQVAFDDLDALAAAMDDRVAAVLLEAVQGEGGVNPASAEYLHGVRAAVRRARSAVDHRRGADRSRAHRRAGSGSSTRVSRPTS